MAPRKIESHDLKLKQRLNKIGAVMPFVLKQARTFRSSGLWQKVRKLHLMEFPLCFDPLSIHKNEHTSVPATEVHHVRGLATHYHLRVDPLNLRSLCHPCHDAVEKRERGGRVTHYLFKNPSSNNSVS